MALTKNQLLKGVRYFEEFFIEDLKDSVKIRPLSYGETLEIEQEYYDDLHKAGITPDVLSNMVSGTETSTQKTLALVAANAERDFRVVAKALSADGEKWTAEEVKLTNLSEKIVSQIIARVKEIGSGRQEVIESFRPLPGRQEDIEVVPSGLQAGREDRGPDPGADRVSDD